MRDWRTIMESSGLYDPNAHVRTEQVYNYPNGSYIEFFSSDNNLKVRGPGRDILFFNEANLTDFDTFTQLMLRTRKTVFIDFNPADEFHWIYDNILTRQDCYFIKSTYLDNPFLPYEQVKEIENLKNVDSNFWRIYGEGERGHSEGVIYTHWKPYHGEISGNTVFGLDFGYNNPTALTRVTENDQDLYWKEEIYQSHLTNNDLIPLIKQIVKPNETVICDSAEPSRIEELRRAGIKAVAANKNVQEGILFVKSRRLFIHSGSANLLKEIKSYKYMDAGKKKGNEPEVPLKHNDHACFVGWTAIETSEGVKDIDKIQELDLVHTSQGLKRVLKVWDNGTQLTKHYTLQFDTIIVYFRCTSDHLFWTTKGWKKISELKSGMTVSLINTSGVKDLSYSRENDISEVTNEQCTPLYGNFTMESDPQGIISIIKTKPLGITNLETLNSRNQQLIYPIIAKLGTGTILNGQRSFMQRGLRRLKNGIKAMRACFGIPSTEKTHGSTENIKNIRAYNAGGLTGLDILGYPNTVIQTAKVRRIVEGHESYEKVYDLTVEDAHEYYANGVLVHNCDAGRYASLHFKKKSSGLNMSFHR